MFVAWDTVGVGGFLQLLPPPPPPPPPPSLEPPPAHAESPQTASRNKAVAADRIRAKAVYRATRSVTGFERRLQRREVSQLIGELLQAVEDARDFTLRPIDLLRRHLRQRG